MRILPFSAGLVPYRASCTLLNSADEEDPPVAHVEMPLSSRYLERHEDRAEFEYVFDLIASRSISISDWSPG